MTLATDEIRSRLERTLGVAGVDAWTAADGKEYPLALPRTPEECAEVVRVAAAEGWRVLPQGLGSKGTWTRPPAALDLVLSTRELRGASAYEPADGTLTALAGTTMEALRTCVAEGGHHLAPDVPAAGRCTLGGVLAAGQSGFDRLRFGSVRESLLGMRVVRADGALVKSGGALVKNVTGYDLHRAWCGSHGTLGLIVEASLRLHPQPEERALARARCPDRDAVLELARRVGALPLRPLTVAVHDLAPGREGGAWTCAVALAGRGEVVRWELAALEARVPGASWEHGDDDAVDGLREAELRDGRWPLLWLTARRSRLAASLTAIEKVAAEAGLDTSTLAHPLIAQASVWLSARGGGAPPAEALRALAAVSLPPGARLRWRDAPPALAGELPLLDPPPPGLEFMRRLRSRLDPRGTFASGRFHDGL